MDNYKPNSKVSKKQEQPSEKAKVEKVVKGVVKTKKRNGLLGLFVSDEISDVKSYVVFDVLIPAAKKAISDVVTNGIDMILYGETGRRRNTSGPSSKISYREYYDRSGRERDIDRGSRYSRSSERSYDDIILETRSEAEEVISRLDELIDIYGMASIADLYDLVGISGQHTDNKYGWTNMSTATYSIVRDGYRLKLPRVKPL